MSPELSRYGVNDLSGFVIKDPESARNICLGFGGRNFHHAGQKVSLRFPAETSRVTAPYAMSFRAAGTP
jgi:hypothetical protein